MTVSAGPLVTGVPVAVVSETVEEADGAPAVTVCVDGATVSSGCVQVRNDCHAALWPAPGRSTRQNVSWPGGPHAPVPVFTGSVAAAESRMAAARRSCSCPVCAAKSPADMPVVLLGAQASPQWSRACEVAAVK